MMKRIKVTVFAILLAAAVVAVYGIANAAVVSHTPDEIDNAAGGLNADTLQGTGLADLLNSIGWTVSGSNAYTTIPVAGKVGIGINPPLEKLHVAGKVRSDTGLCIGASCITSWNQVGGAQTFDTGFGGCRGEEAKSVVQASDGGYVAVGMTQSYGTSANWKQAALLVKTNASGYRLWQKILEYGNTAQLNREHESPNFMTAAPGGYIIAGSTQGELGGNTNQDMWLVKADSNGNKLWDKKFGEPRNFVITSESASSVLLAADGGYVLVGYNYSSITGSASILLIKTDSNGNYQWNKTLPVAPDVEQRAYSAIRDSNNDYVIAGTHNYPGGASLTDAFLIKTDQNGNKLWEKLFDMDSFIGCAPYDYAKSVIQTSDGGYVIAGYSLVTGGCSNQDTAWLIKTDSAGVKQWHKTFPKLIIGIGPVKTNFNSVIETADGGLAATGSSVVATGFIPSAISADIWLVKTDSSGNKEWERTYGNGGGDIGYSVIRTSDGGYAIGGVSDWGLSALTDPANGDCPEAYMKSFTDLYILKVDSEGRLHRG